MAVKEKEVKQTKKNIALIYRLVFIIFSIWGICRHIGFNILNLSERLISFNIVVDVLCLFCMTAVFVVSITRNPGKILRTIKNILTFCAVIVLLKNASQIADEVTYQWILAILLPVMMIIDRLLFDESGDLNFYDPFLWLVGAALLMGLLGFLLKSVFGADDFLDIIGLFSDKDELLDLLKKALGLGFLMYIIDCIRNAIGKKSFKKTFALIYRLLFLALECYAFVNHIGKQLPQLLINMRYYYVLVNFLAAVCIAVTVIYNLIRFKSLKMTKNPFPVLKGAFTVAMLVSSAATLMLGRSVLSFDLPLLILNYIAPIMMLFDWVLFDVKGSFSPIDVLFFMIIPIGYYIYAMIYPQVISVYPGIYDLYKPELILGVLATVAIVGFAMVVVDKILSKKTIKGKNYAKRKF